MKSKESSTLFEEAVSELNEAEQEKITKYDYVLNVRYPIQPKSLRDSETAESFAERKTPGSYKAYKRMIEVAETKTHGR